MSGGAGHEKVQQARCIVWAVTPAGAHGAVDPVPPQLLAALERPGFRLVQCRDEFAAMAEACAPHRAEPLEATILLLVEPVHLPGAPDVASLLARYAPKVVMWAFEASASPQLRAVVEANIRDWRQPGNGTKSSMGKKAGGPPQAFLEDASPAIKIKIGPAAPPAPSKPQAPVRLRLAGEGPLPAPPATNDPSSRASTSHEVKALKHEEPPPAAPVPHVPTGGSSSLLTDEELAMLLATDNDKGHY